MTNKNRDQSEAPDKPEDGSNKRWYVTTVITLGMANSYFDRVALSVALPLMITTVDLSNTQIGIALAAFFWSYTLFQVPSGYIVDRIGVRKPYIWSYILWSIASAGTALTYSFGFLIVMRIILGIGESMVAPASMRYIRIHFEEELRGKALGLFMSGSKIGPAIGFPVAGYLAATVGWEYMFVILGFGGLLFLIPWIFLVKDDDPAALSRKEQEQLAARTSDQTNKWDTGSIWDILQSPALWGILLGTFCIMYFVYYSMTWMPIYLDKEFGMSIKEMAWYPGVAFGGMAVVVWFGGYAADWIIARDFDSLSVRKGFIFTGLFLASSQTIAAYIDNETVMLILAVVSLWGLGLTTANYWALTHSLMPGGRIGTIVGIQNATANLAGVVAPIMTGFLVDLTGTFDAPIKLVGVILVIGILAYLLLVKQKYAPVKIKKPRQDDKKTLQV